MPAVRSFTAESLRGIRDGIAPSVVQLAVFGFQNYFDESEPIQLGTGIVLSRTDDRIGIITTVNCDEDDQVVARFGDHISLAAKVVMRSGPLFGLIVRADNLDAVPCIPANFYEGELLISGPTFVVGCQGVTNHQIIVSGMTSVEEFQDVVRGEDLCTFVHTCPIGDGLMGAPVLNQFGEVLGINLARTRKTSKINYALKNVELRKMLARLVGVELKLETGMTELLSLLSQKISNSALPMKPLFYKRRNRGIASGPNAAGSSSPLQLRVSGYQTLLEYKTLPGII